MMKINVISGFLGSGKTTLIRGLLEQKPNDERWLIIVNEFGEVGIDGALLASENSHKVLELPGGCICCTVGDSLKETLQEVLRTNRTDRLIIEPTGLGHPGGIMDALYETVGDNAEIMAVMTLVDPRNIEKQKYLGHQTFQDQVVMADVLIATKIDLCTEHQLSYFQEWSENLFPAKQQIWTLKEGLLPASILDEKRVMTRLPRFNPHHKHSHDQKNEIKEPTVDLPSFYNASGYDTLSFGVVFSKKVIFEASRLQYYLEHLDDTLRVKGVFRTNHEWASYNRVGNDVAALYPSSYRKDSRLELLLSPGSLMTFQKFQEGMMKFYQDCMRLSVDD